jgi:hypothetical protein
MFTPHKLVHSKGDPVKFLSLKSRFDHPDRIKVKDEEQAPDHQSQRAK